MKIIGVTGGIGSGKTAVLDIFRTEYDAYVCEADALAHKLMEPGGISYAGIVDAFGTDILDDEGQIDRGKLGDVVFADEAMLHRLNEITHPNVRKAILDSIETQKRNGCGLYVLEAALLIQDGYLDICDEMWFVYAAAEVRIDRLVRYRGFSRKRAVSVIKAQEPDSFYEENCSKKIDNSGNLQELKIQIRRALGIEA